jgi:hypothetical protein
MRLIAFLTEPASIRAILAHLGEPTTPPVLAPRARAPPELDAGLAFDFAQRTPERSSFDQTLR